MSGYCVGLVVLAQQHARRLDYAGAVDRYRAAWQAGRAQAASDDWLFGIARLYWSTAELGAIDAPAITTPVPGYCPECGQYTDDRTPIKCACLP